MSEPRFCKGERYRLGLTARGFNHERDAWTGVEVRLDSLIEDELWVCEPDAGGERIIVSAQRLRGAAYLGKD